MLTYGLSVWALKALNYPWVSLCRIAKFLLIHLSIVQVVAFAGDNLMLWWTPWQICAEHEHIISTYWNASFLVDAVMYLFFKKLFDYTSTSITKMRLRCRWRVHAETNSLQTDSVTDSILGWLDTLFDSANEMNTVYLSNHNLIFILSDSSYLLH